MPPLYIAIILGIIEGMTEFLPVSSTGHLIIAGHVLGFVGAKAETFDIVIQLGAILAVVVVYWDRFWGLLTPKQNIKFSGKYGIYLLFLTSIPASLLGLLTHKYIKLYLFSPTTVAWALGAGAVMIIVVESVPKRERISSVDEISPWLAFGIGCFQCLALWPGFSRSAATIMGGMLLGVKRSVAAEYSFLAAVPIMFAATGYDFLKNYQLFNSNDLFFLSVGFSVSFLSAWCAIKGFIYLLGKLSLRPFAIYRLMLVPIILLFL
ncbi:undecaprenyl-diphosphate phosphatase [Pseudodesulfovibrio piezophilus]|uniref:Undecaprenyl-diphosphatase n=1 Tax=Pseudodesulfovibrio piezophilus (strain DSM 21447 / JCM 15486 / C1TLV30) TaxID=1322246 RepID=M1WNM0_PSEP2|nr:undecaprenyl-diphosphate phosphatase [Pseudodesulfovibrio piezophilus]CCH47669.1 Undecaprenyl-diphosphatase [Pseudodesulfovibrio piezophilus C1TLV30]